MSFASRPNLGSPQITIISQNVDGVANAGAATASYSLEADGDIVAGGTGPSTPNGDIGDWIIPRSAAGAAYECRMTTAAGPLGGGTMSGSALGTWLSLSADRTWQLNKGIVGVSTWQGTLELGYAGTSTAIATDVIDLEVTRT
jgi:hypothetical protein